MAKVIRVTGYVRVSTGKQAISPEAQRKAIESYVAAHPELHLVDILVEPAQSAKSLERRKLTQALASLGKTADAILVAKLDRLTRSLGDLDKLIQTYFSEGKYHLLSVSEQIDSRTAAGRLVLHVLVSVFQWEREAIGERTSAALQHKRSLGERVSGQLPYGSRLGPDATHLEPDPAEQAVLAAFRTLRASGLSLRAIAAQMAKQGHLNREGRPFAFQQLARWDLTTAHAELDAVLAEATS